MANNEVKYNGIGFASILQLVFITLKLTGHITWSWAWVLSPTLIQLAILAIVLIGYGLYLLATHKE